jgi:hypothetical protein
VDQDLPCLICGRLAGVEAAHTGPHGIGQKSADTPAIPLCGRHHRYGRDSYHKLGARAFERHHHLNIRAVAEHLASKPAIRIESALFVGHYNAEKYVLGPVHAGIRSAIRDMLVIKREDQTWRKLDYSLEPDLGEFLRIRKRITAEDPLADSGGVPKPQEVPG